MCSKSTNAVYVGAARDVLDRWCNHLYALRRHDHAYNSAFLDSYKNGTLALFLLEQCNKADLPKREQHWMDMFPERINKYRYSTPVGNKNSVGKKLSVAHIEAIRKSWLGQHHTQEAKDKIRAAHLGRTTITPKGREKMRAAKLGNKIWVGRKHTTESINKMSKAHKGRVNTVEHNAAIGRGQLGKKRSAETCAKIGDANRRRVFTPEMIDRIKKAQQARWAKVRASKLSVAGTKINFGKK